ncbi:MAG TPA: ABC transporter ATP-binding protein [Syntrophales bacterium]|jgi:tungstate transport system ATP-binding protein|nr:ABC transporter ATP-binding protein [Syntrophales bacterium]HRT61513.1 ABC transporter ATP-binding protein [Syntrophales bacterium]
MTTILEARNLKVIRGGSLLVDVPDLAIFEGETLSLIGPNGAGKTTLLQALSFLTKPSGGEILFRGQAVGTNHRALEYRRRLAMVFQEPLLFDTTVFENVASGPKIRRLGAEAIRKAVAEQLNRFGISHLRDRSARTLSGGEAQRTSLARAFAIQPEILFLDEPFASLDPPTREAIIVDLGKAIAETGTTTAIATHDRNEALRLSDRIAMMDGGRIVQIGSPSDVMNRPVDELVAAFVGIETILHGLVREKQEGSILVDVDGSEIEVAGDLEAGTSVILCIRPENVTLSLSPPASPTSVRNVFPGRIRRITPLGLVVKVEIACGFPLVAYVTGNAAEDLNLREGNEVTAQFKATSIHLCQKKSACKT